MQHHCQALERRKGAFNTPRVFVAARRITDASSEAVSRRGYYSKQYTSISFDQMKHTITHTNSLALDFLGLLPIRSNSLETQICLLSRFGSIGEQNFGGHGKTERILQASNGLFWLLLTSNSTDFSTNNDVST